MSKEKQIEEIAKVLYDSDRNPLVLICGFEIVAEDIYNAGYRKLPENLGEFSDGYHTFNELYHHRAVLFSVICNMFPDRAWKSKLHDTGDMYDGMFIVGIETEQGQATYHYDIDPYWDIFKVKELEKAPKYDGHSPSDAIDRIGDLSMKGYRKQSEWISVEERLPDTTEKILVYCSNGEIFPAKYIRVQGLEFWFEETYSCHNITHWMPLPEPPKMKGGAE